ncbi:MAG TPA: arylsulfatase [Bryobacteraceae bacterium]|nr:arylsulfatase [Bryobacteraceae bacterium]
MNRRTFLRSAAASAIPSVWAQQGSRKPNFVVILADDMGYSDAACYGGDIDTPNLDKLAAGGLRFTQAYSTARCGPSRNCLLTGYYAQQTAADVMTPGNTPRWTRFLPEYLKPLGYRSYHSGKWHIKFKAMKEGAGFDRSFMLLDENRYFPPRLLHLNEQPLPPIRPDEKFYLTNAIGDHGVRFLQEHSAGHPNDPFLLYLAFTSPHFPLHALQEDIDRYKDRFSEGWDAAREKRFQRMRRMGVVNCELSPLEPGERPRWSTPDSELLAKIGPGEVTRAVAWSTLTPAQKNLQRTKMAIHAAMVTCMDRQIGRVVEQLRSTNQLDNTVILFLSDNGASAEQIIRGDGHDASAPAGSRASYLCLGPGWASASNTPFRLHKSYVHEGGIASPLIVHWPAGIGDKGALRHDPCHFIDVLPTLTGLAGGDPAASAEPGAPPLPGKTLAPAFSKSGVVTRDYLYFNHSNNRAIRVGDWKLVAAGTSGPWELYDLGKDRSEQGNLVADQPGRVRQLSQLWQQRDTEFVKVRESAKVTGKTPLQRPTW